MNNELDLFKVIERASTVKLGTHSCAILRESSFHVLSNKT